MEMNTRLRATNFTKHENMLLFGIVTTFQNYIENKKSDGANFQQNIVLGWRWTSYLIPQPTVFTEVLKAYTETIETAVALILTLLTRI